MEGNLRPLDGRLEGRTETEDKVGGNHRRRITTEETAKAVVAAVWGT